MKQTLVVLGSLLLLFSWLSQQFLFEKWNERLAAIQDAHRDFYTYQSNNALFNVVYEITPTDRQARVRDLQIQNYRYGLQRLRENLSPERLQSLEPKIVSHQQQLTGLPEQLARMQAEIDVIQGEFSQERKEIAQNKARAQWVFWGLYIVGSLLVIAASLSKRETRKVGK